MKAAVYTRYGAPDVVHVTDVEKPAPKDGEVLVRVRAASVNPLDWHFVRGLPYLLRMQSGLRTPKVTRLGVDLAGHVDAVGKNVTEFKPGDAVFGTARGAFAEYVCASELALVMTSDHITLEQAASVPVASLTALLGLRDKGKIQPGQKVLINGASGGVGTFAVQVAKALGADVTGVCSTRNVDVVRSLGADRVIDYTKEDFTSILQAYDILLDNVGNHSLSACRRILNPKGKYIMVSGPAGRWIAPFDRAIGAMVLSRFVSQDMGLLLLGNRNQGGLTMIRELLNAGKVRPVIDRTYKLSEVQAAIRYVEEGHARGKVIITVESTEPM
ncbi:MAG: NAD(P)-dependent alcohol dehydrogenase [Fimbriimonadales bacterium]